MNKTITIATFLMGFAALYFVYVRMTARRLAVAYADLTDKAWFAGFNGEKYPFLDRYDLNLVTHFDLSECHQNGLRYLNDYNQHCKELR